MDKEGRKDNSMGSCFLDGNTAAPHSDSRILKDRKKQMMPVVGERCLRELSWVKRKTPLHCWIVCLLIDCLFVERKRQ